MKRKYFNTQNPKHNKFRKDLRRHATTAERLLWVQLRKKQMVLLFRRQYSIGNYIVDFLCPSLQLIIELDGEYHDEPTQKTRDQIRENKLTEMKYVVIRFKNEEVLNNLERVLTDIRLHMVDIMKKFHFNEKSWRMVLGDSKLSQSSSEGRTPSCPSPPWNDMVHKER